MKAVYKKESIPVPEKESETYTNYSLLRELNFVVNGLRSIVKSF